MDNKPKTIQEMQRESSSIGSKFVIIPKRIRKFKKGDKDVNLPTDMEIKSLNK